MCWWNGLICCDTVQYGIYIVASARTRSGMRGEARSGTITSSFVVLWQRRGPWVRRKICKIKGRDS